MSGDLVAIWLQLEVALWVVGLVTWLIGLARQWRLRRRFAQKMGKDMYSLDEVADRYLERPWLWLVEAPRVVSRMAAVGTTPIDDEELEAMRRTFRQWVTVGGIFMIIALVWFLAPVVWLLVTRW